MPLPIARGPRTADASLVPAGAARIAVIGCAGLVLALLSLSGQTPAPAAEDPLLGIWAGEATFGPPPREDLTVRRGGGSWTASLAGVESSFRVKSEEVRFALRGVGEFRGRLAGKAGAISGFWIQLPSRDPGGAGQPFASPIVLKRDGANAWRGRVEPLDDRFTLYLKIFRAAAESCSPPSATRRGTRGAEPRNSAFIARGTP